MCSFRLRCVGLDLEPWPIRSEPILSRQPEIVVAKFLVRSLAVVFIFH